MKRVLALVAIAMVACAAAAGLGDTVIEKDEGVDGESWLNLDDATAPSMSLDEPSSLVSEDEPEEDTLSQLDMDLEADETEDDETAQDVDSDESEDEDEEEDEDEDEDEDKKRGYVAHSEGVSTKSAFVHSGKAPATHRAYVHAPKAAKKEKKKEAKKPKAQPKKALKKEAKKARKEAAKLKEQIAAARAAVPKPAKATSKKAKKAKKLEKLVSWKQHLLNMRAAIKEKTKESRMEASLLRAKIRALKRIKSKTRHNLRRLLRKRLRHARRCLGNQRAMMRLLKRMWNARKKALHTKSMVTLLASKIRRIRRMDRNVAREGWFKRSLRSLIRGRHHWIQLRNIHSRANRELRNIMSRFKRDHSRWKWWKNAVKKKADKRRKVEKRRLRRIKRRIKRTPRPPRLHTIVPKWAKGAHNEGMRAPKLKGKKPQKTTKKNTDTMVMQAKKKKKTKKTKKQPKRTKIGGFKVGSKQNPGKSCLHIRNARKPERMRSGRYWIVYERKLMAVTCDMRSHGGGWTAVINPTATGDMGLPIKLHARKLGGRINTCGMKFYRDKRYGFHRVRGYACGDFVVEWNLQFKNSIGAKSIMFAATVQGENQRSLRIDGARVKIPKMWKGYGKCAFYNGQKRWKRTGTNQCWNTSFDRVKPMYMTGKVSPFMKIKIVTGNACQPSCKFGTGFNIQQWWVR